MEQEIFNQFDAGWCPSDNRVNGRRNGLLQMDNLELDENGALVLCGGTAKIGSAYSSGAHTLESLFINNTKSRYLMDGAGKIFRNGTEIASGGSTSIGAVGAAFEFVILLSGALRKKDNGITVNNLFIPAPTTHPTITPQAPDSIDISKNLTAAVLLNAEGSIVSASAGQINITTDAATFRVKVENTTGYPVNGNVFAGGTATQDDIFAWAFQCQSPEKLLGVRVEVLLDTPASPGDSVADYFVYDWFNEPNAAGQNPFNQGFNSWSIIQALRSDFTRAGTDSTKDWSTIRGFRVTVAATAVVATALTSLKVSGGTKSNLSGIYEWMQLNVEIAGAYVNKSVIGISTGQIYIPKAYVQITPVALPVGLATESWIFRKIGGFWYRVKQLNATTGFSPFLDLMSDADAIKLNITANEFTFSLDPSSTPDDILEVAGPIFGRTVYATYKEILISDINSPGTYDYRKVFKVSGNNAEKLLWVRKVTENTILIGTTQDNYILTGTWETTPDGFLDVYLRPLGTSAPALTRDCVVNGNRVIYFASQGWVEFALNGQVQVLMGIDTDRLYRNQACYNYSPANIQPFSSIRYSCAIARNKLWCCVPLASGSRRLEVYDFARKYWRPVFLNPALICTEADNKVIAFFGDDGFLREVDLQSSKLLDGTTGQSVAALWTVRSGPSRLTRKDLYDITFKINTGGFNALVYLFLDESTSSVFIGSVNTSVLDEVQITFVVGSSVNLKRSWQVQIVCAATGEFVLTDMHMNFDSRPIPTGRMHVPVSNFGSFARKRIPVFSFLIDGPTASTIQIVPKIDGVTRTLQSYAWSPGKTLSYEFSSDVTGIDFEFELTAGAAATKFEYMGMAQPRVIEVLPGLTKFYRSPTTNFGKYSPKVIQQWPLVLNCMNQNVTVSYYGDGSLIYSEVVTGLDVKTYPMFFSTETPAVDFYFTVSSPADFELHDAGLDKTKFSYVYPLPTKLIQIGPLQIFRYGKIKAIELILEAKTTLLSYSIQFDNKTPVTGTIATTVGRQLPYVIPLPQTVGGSVLTIKFTATSEFYYTIARIQHSVSGNGSRLDWTPWNAN